MALRHGGKRERKNRMKHKVRARTLVDFCRHWEVLVQRLKQTGEKIVQSKFVLDERPIGSGYAATVWTEREEAQKGAGHE